MERMNCTRKAKNMNDQSAKSDAGKLDLTLVPRQIIRDIAEVREYGNRKYGDPENWRTVELQRYRAAAFRHFLAYLDDTAGVDAESGIKHYKHLACNLAFICEMEEQLNKIVGEMPHIAQIRKMMTDECCGSCGYMKTNTKDMGVTLYCGNKKAEEWYETVSWDHCCKDWKGQEDE